MDLSRPVAAVGVAAVTALAAPSGAPADTPPGSGLTSDDRLSCDNGATVVVHSAGPSSWIDGGHYLVATRTLTFSDGSTDVQVLGERSGLSDKVTCTAELPSATLTLTLVLVPPASD
jgi:hypothetical protein